MSKSNLDFNIQTTTTGQTPPCLQQQIDISYDLVGILPASMLNDLQNGETA